MADGTVENKVVVNIYGEEYPITGVTNPSYISKIADYVDLKMNESAKAGRTMSRDKIAILAAMSIASELYEKKETSSEVDSRITSQIDTMLAKIDSALS